MKLDNLPRLCAHCGATNPSSARFCESCGHSLDSVPAEREVAEATDAPARTRGRKRSAKAQAPEPGGAAPDRAQKAQARREFARVKQVIGRLRAMYWIGAAWCVILLWQLWRVGATLSSRDLEIPGLFWFLAAYVGCSLAVSVAGALFVARAPVLWSILLAGLQTLQFGLTLAEGSSTIGIGGQGFWMLVYWAAVGQAVRVQKLMEENPDFELVRSKISDERKVAGGVADAARERRREAARGKTGNVLKIGGLAAAALVVVGGGAWLALRPPSVDATVEAFAKAWNAGNSSKLAAFYPGGAESRTGQRLTEEIARRGWTQARPKIEEASRDGEDDWVNVVFKSDARTVEVAFRREKSKWHAATIRLPSMKPAPIQAAIADFERAWNTSNNTNEIFALMEAGFREAKEARLKRVFEKRQWINDRPEIGKAYGGEDAEAGKTRLRWRIAGDELRVTFEWWHPEWRITGIRFPRR